MSGARDDRVTELGRLIRLPEDVRHRGRALESLGTASADETEAAADRIRHYVASDAFGKLRPEVRAAFLAITDGSRSPDDHRTSLEAIVQTTGRPALRILKGFIDPLDPEAAGWAELEALEAPIRTLTASVGRIDLQGAHVGTGFVVAPGCVLTNRHVLEQIARAFAGGKGETWLMSGGEITIDFDAEDGTMGSRRFRIRDVVNTGPDPIEGRLDLRKVDAAVLGVETVNARGDALPDPVPLASPGAPALAGPSKIVSIGYPGPPDFSPAGATPTPDEVAVLAALKRIFAYRYGVKRLSPGRIRLIPGEVEKAGAHIFTHDATTLGGASGSLIASLDREGPRVVGLHFGGELLRRNFGLAVPTLRKTLLKGLALA